MQVIVGETRSKRNITILREHGWGRMFVVQPPTPFPFEKWCFDNKAFPPWQEAGCPIGLSIEDWDILWDSENFERRLKLAEAVESDPYMAVTPDIPGGGLASLEFSLSWRMDLMNCWPWYLAVQDGMTQADVEPHLYMFAGIFLGGSDKFKGTALQWCKLAHKHQRKFHYGRAGTKDKLKHAFMVGADSCDSSFPLWTMERMREFVAHMGGLRAQLVL